MGMKNLIQAAACAALLTLVAPAVSVAATAQTTTTQHYTTSLTELYGSPAPYSGKLDLRVNPSGIVSGYYFPDDGALYVPVVGGQTGDRIWLDIGRSGNMHVEGRVQAQGVIVGTAFDKGNGQFSFVAQPQSGEAR
jgi:hypothetical protein